ncbi:helix-turn-helix domain-containing protein [Solihabitans fulvus]|uniref:helix-turn-helix domain-containing protein n=1 Tax=Solihabitans fulvus TaxID=1892852 RepID=UPI001CB76919|nr:helix-turn-helix transcriptional regulator [Solihabitans fulvus]
MSVELRALREARKLSCKDVARALGCSESKISRMETGNRGLYADDVAAVLGFLQVPGKVRQDLLALVREGEERNWHQFQDGKLPVDWKTLIQFEDEATELRNYETLLVPGLAQTAEYAREIIHGTNCELSEAEVEYFVAARMTRQLILSRHRAPSLHLLIEETALRRPIGDAGVMQRQLQHLPMIASRPNITLQVAPFDAGAHPGLCGPFMILDFIDQPTLAYMESHRTIAFLEEEEHVRRAKTTWAQLCAMALSAEDSIRLIADLAGTLT